MKPDVAPSSTGSGPAADARRGPSLATLRSEIDRIDKELVALLNRRAEISQQIGQVKQKQGIEVWSPAREEEVITRALAGNRGPIRRRRSG